MKYTNLILKLNNPKELSDEMKKRWKIITKNKKLSSYSSKIIFLAELLQILDNDSKCTFTYNDDSFSEMGTTCESWCLSTQSYSIYHEIDIHLSDTWEKMQDGDVLEINGFNDKLKLEWDGSFYPDFKLIIKKIDEDLKKKITKLAKSLFKSVK